MTYYDKKGREVEIKPGAVYYENGEYRMVDWGHKNYFSSYKIKHPILAKIDRWLMEHL